MESLIRKYSAKLSDQKLCTEGAPVLGALDDEIIWNRDAEEIPVLVEVINGLNINSILFSETREPFKSIINYLAVYCSGQNGFIRPDDTETRTFLHDIPVAENFTAPEIIAALKRRKGVIITGRGIITYGTVSPEQAFVTFSSICFSCYVKFMTDFYFHRKKLFIQPENPVKIAEAALKIYDSFISGLSDYPSYKGPFNSADYTIKAIIEAGLLTVRSGMVDSFFGNISAKAGDTIYISQTGSSLDELAGFIDPCPADNSTSNAITSSSEFSAHKSIYELTDRHTILHGHPKFSVTMSMLCDDINCVNRGMCHIKCSRKRFIDDIPIIPGEVGTGPTGLSRTLPPAMTGRGAVVFGHGLFTCGKIDFSDAYDTLIDVEKYSFRKYVEFTGMG